MAASAPEPGFGLVELMVALTIFSFGALGVAGTALVAADRLRAAEAEQDAVLLASALLDSLAQTGMRVSPHELHAGGRRAWWSVDDMGGGLQRVRLKVQLGAHRDSLEFDALLAPDPLPRAARE